MTEQTKTRPQITGQIQEKRGTNYVKIAKVALWKQPKNGNQPTLKGNITYENGSKQQIALWEK